MIELDSTKKINFNKKFVKNVEYVGDEGVIARNEEFMKRKKEKQNKKIEEAKIKKKKEEAKITFTPQTLNKVRYQRTVDDLVNWKKDVDSKLESKRQEQEKQFKKTKKKKSHNGKVYTDDRFVQLTEPGRERTISPPPKSKAETVGDRLHSYQNIYMHKRHEKEMSIYGQFAQSNIDIKKGKKKKQNLDISAPINKGEISSFMKSNNRNNITTISTFNQMNADQLVRGFNNIPIKSSRYNYNSVRQSKNTILNRSVDMSKDYSYMTSRTNRSRTPTSQIVKELHKPIEFYINSIKKDLRIN